MKISQEECIVRFHKTHGNKYDYSKVKYENQYIKVCIICPIHGEFWQTPKRHWNGSGCSACSRNQPLTTEIFIKRSKEIHGDEYDYSKSRYVRYFEPLEIICPHHGSFLQTPSNHLSGHGCRYCKGEKISIIKRFKLKQFIEKATAMHGERYIYTNSEYTNNHTDICIVCKKHGEFWQKPLKHLQGHGCPKCNSSHLENEIRQFLQEKNIKFEEQKKFKWLNKQSLDFYIQERNVAIECQGIQHFEPRDFSGCNEEKAKEIFKAIQERDQRKRKLCEENDVKILYFSNLHIEYPYKVYEDKEELFKEIFSI